MSQTSDIYVLHVDDEPNFADMAAEFLEREDDRFTVETATSASEALDRLAADSFDCIVSDYDMPGQNGIEFLETVREEYPALPFILYTGKGSEEVASDAISAGVTDYLQKGSGTSQYAVLANRIRNAVEKYSAQRELADREQRLNLFFEQSPLGVIEWDENFDFARMNDAAEEILGYAEADLEGRSWEVIVPESDSDAVGDVVTDLLENKGGYHSINENVRKDGERIICEWHNRVVTDENDDVVAIFSQFQDITERKEREQAIEHLHSTTRALMEAETAEQIADIAVDAVRDILDLPANGVHLYDESENGLVPVAWTTRTEEIVGEPPTFVPGEGIAWRAFETGDAQIYDDISTVPDRYNPDTDVRSQIILPLGDHGVFLIGSETPDAFDDTDVSLAETLATHVTTALDRIEHEQSLQEEREFIEQALDTLDDLFYVVGPDGTLRRWNDHFSEVTGYTDEELADMHATEFFPEDEQATVTDEIEETLTSGETIVEAELVTKDGERIPYEFTGSRLTDPDGEVIGLIGIGRDISERKQREHKLEALFDNAPLAIAYTEFEGEEPIVRDVNAAFEQTFGYDAQTAVGESLDDLIVPDDKNSEASEINQQVRAGDHFEIEVRRDTPDGLRDFIHYPVPLQPGDSGERSYAIYHDVTERKKWEDALKQLHAATRELMAATTIDEVATVGSETAVDVLELPLNGICLSDADDEELVPVAWSEEMEALLNGTPPALPVEDSLAGETYQTGEPHNYADVHEADAPLNPETDVRSELHVPIGEHGVLMAGSTTRDEFDATDETLAQILATNLESALDRVEREQTLQRQNERLEQFTSVVSHDLRNPLDVASGRLALAQQECDSDHLDDVAEAHERMETLIDDLLTLARTGDRVDETEAVDLADMIDNCWRTVETVDATLVSETDQTIRADPSRLKQLLENLFRNAVEHGGGDVTVMVGDLDDKNGFYVADDGPGIPEDDRDDVFEAGYSTTVDGTGFGLNIVQEIAEAHGWEITVTDSETGGARVRITGVETAAE